MKEGNRYGVDKLLHPRQDRAERSGSPRMICCKKLRVYRQHEPKSNHLRKTGARYEDCPVEITGEIRGMRKEK